MIEKINPTIPIPITSSPIPDEQREIIMAKSSIAIPNPIFFIVNPPLQMPICCHLHYTSLAIEKIAYFMKLVGWEQLATQGVPRWQVHKRVAGGSQRRGSVTSPVCFGADHDCGKSQPSGESLRRTQCTNRRVVYNCALSKLRGFRLLPFQQFFQ